MQVVTAAVNTGRSKWRRRCWWQLQRRSTASHSLVQVATNRKGDAGAGGACCGDYWLVKVVTGNCGDVGGPTAAIDCLVLAGPSGDE